jgi:hypothetical protein
MRDKIRAIVAIIVLGVIRIRIAIPVSIRIKTRRIHSKKSIN